MSYECLRELLEVILQDSTCSSLHKAADIGPADGSSTFYGPESCAGTRNKSYMHKYGIVEELDNLCNF